MHEKANLREANLNGAIIADGKLGGARLDEGFCCGTYTALRVTSSPPRTLHRHTENDFRPRPMSRRDRRLSTPFGARPSAFAAITEEFFAAALTPRCK
jgi:hypothetical protein